MALATMKRVVVIAGSVLFCLLVLSSGAYAQEGLELRYGDVVQGRITSATPRNVYYFQARRGDVLSIAMRPLDGNLDPILVLTDNAGNVLARSDDVAGTVEARLDTVQVPDDGYYFVVASRFGMTTGVTEGAYELSLQRVGVLSLEGVFLSYGDSVVGLISDQDPVLEYVFEAQRGDIINVIMRRISGNLDSFVEILDEKDRVVASNDDFDGDLDAGIEDLLILDPGYYRILASRFGKDAGDSRGSFVLTLDTAPTSGQGLTPDSALLIRYGESARGTLNDEVPLRYYTFGARRGDIVTFRMNRASGNLDPYLVLSDARGIQLVEDDDSGPSNNALIEAFIIPESGTYFIQVGRFELAQGQTSGDYVLDVEGITGEAPVVDTGILTVLYGSTVTGEITDQQPMITYAFLGNAGDIVTIDLATDTGNLDPYLLLFTSTSMQLGEDDDSGPGKDARIGSFVLPADDIYYIVATRYGFQGGDTQGRFRLSLNRQAE